MNATVEEITRLVIAALARQGLPVAAAPSGEPLTPSTQSDNKENQKRSAGECGCGCGGKRAERSAPEPGSWQCSDRLISQATLAGRLDGVTRLVVSRRAVITPAAADLLRDQGVVVARGEPTQPATPGHKLLVALAAGERSSGDWMSGLESRGIQRVERQGKLAELIPWLERGLRSTGGPALLVAGQPYAAACQVNRRAALRAAVVPGPAAWSEITTGFAPNVAVLDAARWTAPAVLELVGLWTGSARSSGCGCATRSSPK